jgi:alpha-galactosidase
MICVFRQSASGLVTFFLILSLVMAEPRSSEQADARDWAAQHLAGEVASLPFSFQFNSKPSSEVLKTFKASASEETTDENRKRRVLLFTDPDTGLEVRCVAVEYSDFPTVEWTLYFKNKGNIDTPILSDIRALDITLDRGGAEEFILHHHKGSRATQTDFRPRATVLEEGLDVRLRSLGGRGTNGTLPYFNIQGPKQGLIAVVGWPGQWDAQFQRDATTKLFVRAGQEQTHFKLLPGEEVRTPLVVLQFYEGDPQRAQNIWRRWMVQHNLPRIDGEVPPTQLVACSSHQFAEMINANEENQKHFIDRYIEEDLGISSWWMDAGWYVNDGKWTTTGTWEVDRRRFPRGLRTITDHARAKGLKAIVWFEPERVAPGTWLYNERPEWLLEPPPNPGDQLYDVKWRLLNLGHTDALTWLVDHVDRLIHDEGIDLYRQDFNVDPLLFWRANDAADRQGITEIKHVTGYLAFWDELRRRNPDLVIDTCASGGRRLDLETLRRSLPFLRSDYLFEPIGQQCHSFGIARWIPYHGTGTLIGRSAIGLHTSDELNSYDFRSHMACSVTACWDLRREDLDYDELRRLTGQLREAAPNFLGDFHPLTPYSTQANVWMAWQYDRPKEGAGVVQAFRRDDNQQDFQVFQLRGLDSGGMYQVKNADSGSVAEKSGAELMASGLKVELPRPRSAALIFYHKIAPAE